MTNEATAKKPGGKPGFVRRLSAFAARDWERPVLLVLYAYIVAVIFVEVVRRFVFSYSSVWGEETARYAFAYLVWIGAAAAVRERAHIRIGVIFQFVPPRAKTLLYLLGEVLTFAFGAVALYYSLESVLTSIKFDSLTSGLRINRAWFTAAVPLGFFLILLRLSASIARDIADLRAGRPPFAGKAMFSDGN
ncbi:MAG: TRAP transporter small permease [Gammaproteobacteria bacterium]